MFRPARADARPPVLPGGFPGIVYIEFLAQLCARRGVRNYLEIGVHFGHTLRAIPCDTAVGVDPGFVLDTNVTEGKRRVFLFQETSDRFFAENDLRTILGGPIDLAFLDGLHQFEFLLRDIHHAERACGPDGLIVLHDCLPLSAEMADRDGAKERTDHFAKLWTGDVWKVVPILQRYRPDLGIVLVDCPPTGLVCLTGLDPASTVLSERYMEIVHAFRDVPNTAAEIARIYGENEIVSSAAILNGQDQGLYFRT